MRIDEIDLTGLVLVKGATSNTGQVLSYNESGSIGWATASSGSAPTSIIKKSGYNYIIVETVRTGDESADAITNGDRLFNAYLEATSNIVGTLSATNRFTIILMPGVYDLFNIGNIVISTSFIDFVGLSTNPKAVSLLNNSSTLVFTYGQDVDSRLENVSLDGYISDNSESGQYLRWKNLILSLDPFQSTFSIVNGEFENIRSTSNLLYDVPTSINGIFKNIQCIGSSFTLFSPSTGTITGTYSDIRISDVPFSSFYAINGNITGYYENLSFTLDPAGAGSQEVFRSASMNGSFENIRVTNNEPINTFFCTNGGSLLGSYKEIELLSSSANSVFFCTGLTMSGIFEDINLPTCVYAFSSNNDIVGTYSNIKIADITTGGLFISGNYTYINGHFENITTGSLYGGMFVGGTIDGTYKNIHISSTNGAISTQGFVGSTFIKGIFDNIKVDNVIPAASLYFQGGYINGKYTNIEFFDSGGNTYFFAYLGINIEVDNLKITGQSVPYLFYNQTGNDIEGVYKNIECGDVDDMFRSDNGSISGTYENITINNVGRMFFIVNGGSGNLHNNIKNITINGNAQIFMSSVGDIDMIGEDIFIKNIGEGFLAPDGIVANLKNIRINNFTSFLSAIPKLLHTASGNLQGLYENILIDSCSDSTSLCFWSYDSMTVVLKNIEIPNNFDKVLFQDDKTNQSNVTMKNVTIGECTTSALDINFSANTFAQNVVSRNLIRNGIMRGEWIDCDLDQWKGGVGIGYDFNLSGAIVRNSKLLGRVNGPPDYGVSGSGQVTHTILYYDLDFTFGTFPLTPNYNVTGYN
jgi:hypothetical protein